METNINALFYAAFIPLIIGSIWYHPKMMGKISSKSKGPSVSNKSSIGQLAKILLGYVIGVLIAYTLMGITVHQLGVMQTLLDQPGFSDQQGQGYLFFQNFMAEYGNSYRNLFHGLFHGAVSACSFALPVIGSIALYEEKGWKFVMVHFGYWLICLSMMSGLISHFF